MTPKVGGVKLADGALLAADAQFAGTLSAVFNAVAIVLSAQSAKRLAAE